MHIRKRVDADNTALVDLWERSVRATHDFLSEADIVELYPQVRDLFRGRRARAHAPRQEAGILGLPYNVPDIGCRIHIWLIG